MGTTRRVIALGALLALVCLYGCDDSGDDGGESTAGNGGTAGGAGSATLGGAAGTAGSAGTSNGSGGEAGSCLASYSSHDLGDSCGLGPYGNGEYATVSTECSFEATCRELDCGAPWSDFDANGCRRASCTSSSACGRDERCVPRVLYDPSCNPGVYESCRVEDCGSCVCSTSADCNSLGFCQPASAYPPANDCSVNLDDCDAVAEWRSYLSLSDGAFTGDAKDAITACDEKVRAADAACNGVAGAGGAGGEAGNASR